MYYIQVRESLRLWRKLLVSTHRDHPMVMMVIVVNAGPIGPGANAMT